MMFWNLNDGIKNTDESGIVRDISDVFKGKISYELLESSKKIRISYGIDLEKKNALLINTESLYLINDLFKRNIINDFKLLYPEGIEYVSFAEKRYALKTISPMSGKGYPPDIPIIQKTLFNPEENTYLLLFDEKSHNLIYANNVVFMKSITEGKNRFLVPMSIGQALTGSDISAETLSDVKAYVSEEETMYNAFAASNIQKLNNSKSCAVSPEQMKEVINLTSEYW
ncbi:MAG: hypothetical protein ACP5NV_03205 [Candidatus Woesearchaeota archaeon]